MTLALLIPILLSAAGPAPSVSLDTPVGDFTLLAECDVALAFSRDGSKLLTVGDAEARVWDTITWKPIGEPLRKKLPTEPYGWRPLPGFGDPVPHEERIRKAEFDAQAKHVLVLVGGEVIVSEITGGKPVGQPIKHGKTNVRDAAISPDGKHVVTCDGDDSEAHLYEIRTGKRVQTFNHRDNVRHVQFDRSGTTLITTSSDTKLWTLDTGKLSTHIQGPVFQEVIRPAVSDTGLIIAASEGGFRIVDIDTGKTILFDDSLIHLDCQMYGVAISPDGKTCAASSTLDSSIYDVKTGKKWIDDINSFDGDVWFDPTCDAAVILALDDTWGVWDVPADRRVLRFDKREIWINTAAFHPDGRYLAHDCREGTRIVRPEAGMKGPQRWIRR